MQDLVHVWMNRNMAQAMGTSMEPRMQEVQRLTFEEILKAKAELDKQQKLLVAFTCRPDTADLLRDKLVEASTKAGHPPTPYSENLWDVRVITVEKQWMPWLAWFDLDQLEEYLERMNREED